MDMHESMVWRDVVGLLERAEQSAGVQGRRRRRLPLSAAWQHPRSRLPWLINPPAILLSLLYPPRPAYLCLQ